MYTIKNEVITEQTINKSRFITYLFPIIDENDAKEKLSAIRKKHYDATHNCYAYITPSGAKFSDDKEPSKTAGIVIFDVLQKNNLTNILTIVTRYYGGIKLGAGGLVRAYSSSTVLAIATAEIKKIIKFSLISIECDYNIFNIVEKQIFDYEIINKDFGQTIKITIKIPTEEILGFQTKLIDSTKNSIIFNVVPN